MSTFEPGLPFMALFLRGRLLERSRCSNRGSELDLLAGILDFFLTPPPKSNGAFPGDLGASNKGGASISSVGLDNDFCIYFFFLLRGVSVVRGASISLVDRTFRMPLFRLLSLDSLELLEPSSPPRRFHQELLFLAAVSSSFSSTSKTRKRADCHCAARTEAHSHPRLPLPMRTANRCMQRLTDKRVLL